MTEKKQEKEPEGVRDGPFDHSSRVRTEPGAKPGPDVSNLDVDMAAVSFDSAHATVEPAPEQNPEGHVPPPGPQYVQTLGHQDSIGEVDEPVSAQVRPDGGGKALKLPKPELPAEEDRLKGGY